jgi:hypothetical protein
MDTSNSHGIVFGGQADSDSEDSVPDAGEGLETVSACLECCGQN